MTEIRERHKFIKISKKKLLIKEKVFVNLPKFLENVKPLGKSFYVLKSKPMLIEFFIYSMHIGRKAVILYRK